MSLGIKQHRSKSSSDILGEHPIDLSTGRSINVSDSDFFSEHYIPSTPPKQGKSISVEEIALGSGKDTPGSKSQKFFKRLMTHIDKKNESCKADDEFVAQYYKNYGFMQSKFSASLEAVQYPYRNYPTYTRGAYLYRERRNYYDDLTSTIDENAGVNNDHDTKCATLDCTRKKKKKVSRKRSFRSFLESIVKWKKSGNKENCQSVMDAGTSAENNIERRIDSDDNMTNINSIWNTASNEKADNKIMKYNKPAEVASPRLSRDLKTREQRKHVADETKRIFSDRSSIYLRRENSEEALIKPSAIKDISKRLSLLPEEIYGGNMHDSDSMKREFIAYERRKSLDNLFSNVRYTNETDEFYFDRRRSQYKELQCFDRFSRSKEHARQSIRTRM